MAGEVRVGGQVIDKAGTKVAEDAELDVKTADRYVGRGGYKLEAALTTFALEPAGWTCLDIGASTGGFTDCLLQRGAAKVWAIDVGHDQLAWRIRSDPRVVVREGLNARYLTDEGRVYFDALREISERVVRFCRRASDETHQVA